MSKKKSTDIELVGFNQFLMKLNFLWVCGMIRSTNMMLNLMMSSCGINNFLKQGRMIKCIGVMVIVSLSLYMYIVMVYLQKIENKQEYQMNKGFLTEAEQRICIHGHRCKINSEISCSLQNGRPKKDKQRSKRQQHKFLQMVRKRKGSRLSMSVGKRKMVFPSSSWKDQCNDFCFAEIQDCKTKLPKDYDNYAHLFTQFHSTCIYSRSYSTFPATPITNESDEDVSFIRIGNTRAFTDDRRNFIRNSNDVNEQIVDLSYQRRRRNESYNESLNSLIASSGHNSLILYDFSSDTSRNYHYRPPSSGYISGRHRSTSESYSFSSSLVVDRPIDEEDVGNQLRPSSEHRNENHAVCSGMEFINQSQNVELSGHRENQENVHVVSTPSDTQLEEIPDLTTSSRPVVRPLREENHRQSNGGIIEVNSLREQTQTKLPKPRSIDGYHHQGKPACNTENNLDSNVQCSDRNLNEVATNTNCRSEIEDTDKQENPTQPPLQQDFRMGPRQDKQENPTQPPLQQDFRMGPRQIIDESHRNSEHYGSYDRLQNNLKKDGVHPSNLESFYQVSADESQNVDDDQLFGEGYAEDVDLEIREEEFSDTSEIPNFAMLGIEEVEESNMNGHIRSASGDEEETEDHTE